MNIAVYLGSTSGNKDDFSFAARSFGRWIGRNGHTLVYGGANRGLMVYVARFKQGRKEPICQKTPQKDHYQH